MAYLLAVLLTGSGLAAAITASWMILFPPLLINLDHRLEPISNVVPKRVWRGKVFNLGLIATAILLDIYMAGLVIRFGLSSLPLGAILYLVAHIFTVLVGIIPIHRNYKAHSLLTRGYFFLYDVGVATIRICSK